MTPVGFIALGLWLALLALALVGASRTNGPIRWLFGALMITVIYNLLFHLHYQFRGSIFLYASHVNFAAFAFCSAAALYANEIGGRVRTLFRIALAALILSTAAANLPRAVELATAFDDFHPLPEWKRAFNARDR